MTPIPGFDLLRELPDDTLNVSGSVWMFSSGAEEISIEDKELGGVFTHYFIEADPVGDVRLHREVARVDHARPRERPLSEEGREPFAPRQRRSDLLLPAVRGSSQPCAPPVSGKREYASITQWPSSCATVLGVKWCGVPCVPDKKIPPAKVSGSPCPSSTTGPQPVGR